MSTELDLDLETVKAVREAMRGESKMRKVEIKRWVNRYDDDSYGSICFHTKEEAQRGARVDSDPIQVELTGYLEVPERKVEITESMIDELVDGDGLRKYLKELFFPSEEL